MAMEASLHKSGWHLKPLSLLPIVLDYPSMSSPHQFHRLLLDSDLAHFGAPCLPDASFLPRTPRLQGPLVLQVVFVRNISESTSKSLTVQQQGRLLRIGLTDGHTVVSAIEYHSMPAFSLNTAPGTKVKLENIVRMENGILLGDARSLTVLGGHVQALYEVWEIERKYSGLARPTLKSARVEGDTGPPPFHGLPVARQGKQDAESAGQCQQSNLHVKENALERPVTKSTPGPSSMSRLGESSKGHLQGKVAIPPGSANEKDNDDVFSLRIRPGSEPYRPPLMKTSVPHAHTLEMGNSSSIHTHPELLLSPDATNVAGASALQELITTDSASPNPVASSDKDLNVSLGDPSNAMAEDMRVDAIKAAIALGVETAPVQNRAAAQKLLEKRTDGHSKTFPGRGRGASSRGRERRLGRHGRPGMDEQQSMLTLDEWESRKGITNISGNQSTCTDGDAALAQKLQYELNFEGREASSSRTAFDEAEQIRLSMFNFAVDRSIDEHDGERRRGRGRGRGRRRGR